MERFLEDVFEEVALEPEAAKQEHGKHRVENRDLDLNPHRIVRDDRQGTESHGYRGGDQGKGGEALQYDPHHNDCYDRGDE